MATTNIKLKNVPIQITDGTKYGTIQSLGGGNFRWCDSVASPDKTNFHFSSKLNIGLGASIWIWNPSTDDTREMNITYTVVGA